MKGLIKLLAAAVLLLSSVEAQAGGTGTEITITHIAVNSAGVVRIYVSGIVSGRPSCATSVQGFAIDSTTKGGVEMAAVAELAYSLDKSVTVTGAGTCDVTPGWESLSVLEIAEDKTGPGVTLGGHPVQQH